MTDKICYDQFCLLFSNSVSIHFSIIFYWPSLKFSSMNLKSSFVLSSPKISFISMRILPFSRIYAGSARVTLKKEELFDDYNDLFVSCSLTASVFDSTSVFDSALAFYSWAGFSSGDGWINLELLIQLFTCSFSFLNLLLIFLKASLFSGSNS